MLMETITELINGDKYAEKIWAEKKWIVYCYLLYTHVCWAFQYLDSAEKGLEQLISGFTQQYHSDISNTHPQLNTDEIVACFEDHFGDLLHFGDFLQAIASFGQTRHVKDLSDFAQHGLLTFGAIINCKKTKILAYFQSTIAPTWHCKSFSANIEASYSTSVPSRVDLSFQNTDCNQVNFHFSLHYPDPLHHRTAYLSQSLPFIEDCDVPEEDLISIDDI
ncbi:hypothetical protein PQX77_014122 [Marasmius sp. AFHP31]|nr:hypothetical protein PQX77_014122 [Marasmius sp. AFHP31]